MAIIFTTNIILIILGDNVSIASIDESLTQRGRGTRGGRGSRGARGRGTVRGLREERDVHSGKYSYNIHYKYILIILGDNVSVTSIDESLTQRGRGTRGGRGRGTVRGLREERDVHSGK